jgi:hypothetical protein
MTTRQQIQAIADAHINARVTRQWGKSIRVSNSYQLVQELKQGGLYEQVLREIEIRYVSVQTLIMQNVMDCTSETYKRGVRKGFRVLLESRM